MFRILPFLLILLNLTTCKGKETGDTNFLSEAQTLPAHPRLLLLRGEEQKIKENIESDPTWKKIHEAIIHEGDRILKKPLVEYKLSGKRLLERSRECRKKIFYWSYAYRLTHDKKYLAKAEEELLNVSSFPDWNPSHFLDVAEMTMAVAIGYDWLYDDLSVESRKKISDAIIKMGLEPSFKAGSNWWVTEDGNWNQVCNAGMIFGALAIYNENREFAEKIINRSVESVKLAMHVYEPDGAYPEGYSYWAYGTTFNVYLVDALVKAYKTDFGLLENKGFMKTASYLLHMVGPTTLNFNYSDGEAKSKLNPAMFWFANKLNDPSLLFSESKLIQIKDNLSGRELPAIMIWGAGIKLSSLPTPLQLTWTGQGKNPVALMRTSWKDDAIYAAIKGGSPDNGHGHMDVGSFVLDALGVRWAMDFGGQEYNSLESKGVDLWSRKQNSQRWQVFRYNNLAHNTLSFNEAYQLVNGYAPIRNSTSDKTFLSSTVDVTEVYKNDASSAVRGIAIVDESYVVVRDEISLAKDLTTVRWSMVTPATVKIISNNTAELTQFGKTVVLKVQEPTTITLKTWTTNSPNEYDAPNSGTTIVGFEVKSPSKGSVAFSVLLIPQNQSIVEVKKVLPLNQWNSSIK